MIKNNLQKILDRRGMSAKFLSDNVGCSATHISYVINGRRNLSMTLAEKIAEFLDIPVSDLFEGARALNENDERPKDLIKFLEQAEVVFDGESYRLDSEDKKKVIEALEFAFWHAKNKKNRKKT